MPTTAVKKNVQHKEEIHLPTQDEGGNGYYKDWLNLVGFSFDPFLSLEASTDPYLSSYLVGHEAFSVAWGDWHSFVFAPVGGGKTALRMGVTRASWIGQETNRPFPLSYVIPFLKWGSVKPSLDEHLAAIGEAGALLLLLILAYRPHWFFRLTPAEQLKIRRTLDLNLPGPLASFLRSCKESESVEPLHTHFPSASIPPDPPDKNSLLAFIDSLNSLQNQSSMQLSPSDRWESLQSALIEVLAFPAIYILLDGLDGTIETGQDPTLAVDCLSPLLQLLGKWGSQHIFLKAFIPIETRTILEEQYEAVSKKAQLINLKWAPSDLSEMINKRVYAASEGFGGSLGASQTLRLAKASLPLPREMLVLTRRALYEHCHRRRAGFRIKKDVVEAAIAWYEKDKPNSLPKVL